jgi:NAD(P)-dependent dehydrogenase (short-subunit alcohol dehydrogenase family)
MKIIVTGGAGFIGSHTVDALIDAGHKVTVLDDLSTGHRENINPLAVFHNVDLRDNVLQEIFAEEKPDAVYHLAAQVKVVKSISDPVFDLEVNLSGAINLLEACKKNNIKKIIYSSTGGAVYGEPDPDYLPINEKYILNPLSFYGVHKHTVEHYLYLFKVNYGLNYTEKPALSPFFQSKCWKAGDRQYSEMVLKRGIISMSKMSSGRTSLSWIKEKERYSILAGVLASAMTRFSKRSGKPSVAESSRLSQITEPERLSIYASIRRKYAHSWAGNRS